MGLIEHETQIYNIFEEVCQIMLPIQLRKFFATFLLCENIEGFIIWSNPSQIRWLAYAYVTDYFGIKVFLFFSKNYLTRIFLFFYCNKISCVQQCRKILGKSLLLHSGLSPLSRSACYFQKK